MACQLRFEITRAHLESAPQRLAVSSTSSQPRSKWQAGTSVLASVNRSRIRGDSMPWKRGWSHGREAGSTEVLPACACSPARSDVQTGPATGSQSGSQAGRRRPPPADVRRTKDQGRALCRHSSTPKIGLRIRRLGVRIPPSAQSPWSEHLCPGLPRAGVGEDPTIPVWASSPSALGAGTSAP